ncbi:uncharacterized protein LOC128393086 [Panonychus citri]|uniref:uncharacterized protein LOC128393086 n=1 Tax=Panonychus citri TaxID=50023 RepID=UPI002307FFF3|nr:uncharacterized protein LOC128393086 [Panonychus citri]
MSQILSRGCFLKIPYGSSLATLLALCGVSIVLGSFLETITLIDGLLYELLNLKYLWFNDVKVVYIIFCTLLTVVILINLMIGCMTTGRKASQYMGSPGCSLCGSATSCLVKCVFIANYILFYLILALTIAFTVVLFICYIMSRLCSEGRTYDEPSGSNHLPASEVTDSSQQLNLKLFAPLLNVRPNETGHLLVFEGYKLKKLCIDYLSNLYLYVILCFTGFILLCSGFLNYLINLSVNWARISTSQKCAELIYLNSAEMTAFGGESLDVGGRF